MIKMQNVSFQYGDFTALDSVSLHEKEPIIAGLWGRNGAGKTTLMKLLSGLEKPTSGDILVNTTSPINNSEAMKHVTYMQENHPFSQHWSVNDALRFGAYFNPQWDQSWAEYLVELFELPRKKKINKFSKGMQTMVKIVIGLASKAPITIMDEPTNGLDAHMRKKFYQALLESYEDDPRFIFLSTHHIDEIESLCEKIAVVHAKTIIRYEETDQLKQQGILLSGEESLVRDFIKSSIIIEERRLGKQISVMIDQRYTEEWEQLANQKGVSIEKAPLQDYLVNVTTKGVR
ncbi:LOW QUALITY PROTEIN: ABC transporter ATP-binding protein [Bacillus sp. JCM 19046]|nr:LOW QUALITY PROTEIN: ABC transporter ATP-binding protein [Bacillus sp. JCM 19045]GAF18119.1 LOW QUALITY PROTEIN: ABC transporter ATP-binding protein [Bacillus sp. JCM 19046]